MEEGLFNRQKPCMGVQVSITNGRGDVVQGHLCPCIGETSGSGRTVVCASATPKLPGVDVA